jgi:hypothetical protein
VSAEPSVTIDGHRFAFASGLEEMGVMAGPSSPTAALERLSRALAQLDDAIEGRLDENQRRTNLEQEVQVLGADRSRMAQALDGAEARAARLDEANREVSRRLVTAMESIRSVLEKHGG